MDFSAMTTVMISHDNRAGADDLTGGAASCPPERVHNEAGDRHLLQDVHGRSTAMVSVAGS